MVLNIHYWLCLCLSSSSIKQWWQDICWHISEITAGSGRHSVNVKGIMLVDFIEVKTVIAVSFLRITKYGQAFCLLSSQFPSLNQLIHHAGKVSGRRRDKLLNQDQIIYLRSKKRISLQSIQPSMHNDLLREMSSKDKAQTERSR